MDEQWAAMTTTLIRPMAQRQRASCRTFSGRCVRRCLIPGVQVAFRHVRVARGFRGRSVAQPSIPRYDVYEDSASAEVQRPRFNEIFHGAQRAVPRPSAVRARPRATGRTEDQRRNSQMAFAENDARVCSRRNRRSAEATPSDTSARMVAWTIAILGAGMHRDRTRALRELLARCHQGQGGLAGLPQRRQRQQLLHLAMD